MFGIRRKKLISYEDVVLDAMNDAMAIDIRSSEAFEACTLNTLEAVAALYWMVEFSFSNLPTKKREQAGTLVLDELLAWFSVDYSPGEIARLVMPVLKKRSVEYGSSLEARSSDASNSTLMRTFATIVKNVFAVSEPHVAQVAGAILLWWQPTQQRGKVIFEMDAKGEIAW